MSVEIFLITLTISLSAVSFGFAAPHSEPDGPSPGGVFFALSVVSLINTIIGFFALVKIITTH